MAALVVRWKCWLSQSAGTGTLHPQAKGTTAVLVVAYQGGGGGGAGAVGSASNVSTAVLAVLELI
jgi:hypothetical protein